MTTIADAIIKTGLRDLGYINLALDGGWTSFQHGGPPAKGSVGPRGWDFKTLSSYYHANGLKLGMCALLRQYMYPAQRARCLAVLG